VVHPLLHGLEITPTIRPPDNAGRLALSHKKKQKTKKNC